MKLSFALILYNEEKLIKAQLDRLYQYAHEIVICEGLADECKKAWTRERDSTLDIIRSYPDPKNKIKLVSKDNWIGKEHMVRDYWARTTGDYVWHIDADEFYTHKCMRNTIRYIEKTKELQYGHYHQYYYYRFLNVIVEQCNKTFWNQIGRIHKCDKTYTLVHRPQCLYQKGHYAPIHYIKEGIQHHYSMMDHEKTTSKLKFYSVETKRYCDVFDLPIDKIIADKLEVRVRSKIRILNNNEVEIPEGVDKLYTKYKP